MQNLSALILGGSGQDGPFLAQSLIERGADVTSISRSYSKRMASIGVPQIQREINSHNGFLDILLDFKPNLIINLISLSSVASCEENPTKSREINYELVLKLSEEINILSDLFFKKIRFIQASSSEMFGIGNHLCDENTSMSPVTVYGQHKRDAHKYLLSQSHEMVRNISVILFNHESEYRPKNFVSAKAARAAAEVAIFGSTNIEFGYIDSKRDWGFAGDHMQSVANISLLGDRQCYVVSSGELHSVREMLQVAFKYVNIENYERFVNLNRKYFRKIETPPTVGDSSLYHSEFDQKATLTFEQMVTRMVQYQLDEMRGNGNG